MSAHCWKLMKSQGCYDRCSLPCILKSGASVWQFLLLSPLLSLYPIFWSQVLLFLFFSFLFISCLPICYPLHDYQINSQFFWGWLRLLVWISSQYLYRCIFVCVENTLSLTAPASSTLCWMPHMIEEKPLFVTALSEHVLIHCGLFYSTRILLYIQ